MENTTEGSGNQLRFAQKDTAFFQHRALSIKIASFYEHVFAEPMKCLVRIVACSRSWLLNLVQVVDKDSAVLGYPGEEALPIDADHRYLQDTDYG